MPENHLPTILFVDHASALGGAEHSLLWIMAQLQQKGLSLHLACTDGELSTKAQEIGVDVHILSMPRLRHSSSSLLHLPKQALELARIARSIQADIIHSNTTRAAIYAALAGILSHRPHIWHKRDFWLGESVPSQPRLDAWGKKMICGASSKIITNSQATSRHLPCPTTKKVVIYNGIDLSRYDPGVDSDDFRIRFGISESAPVVGMVGRLRPIKGQEQFLRMAALVRAKNPEVHFLIVGGEVFQAEAGYKKELLALVKELHLEEVVTFTGHITDIPQALATMNVFVNPGEPEAFGLVNIEAMAMQKPVVAFAHGALPEIVTPETGILVPPGNVAALADAVAALLAEPQQAAAMGRQGRDRVAQNFTIQQTASKIAEVYHSLITTNYDH